MSRVLKDGEANVKRIDSNHSSYRQLLRENESGQNPRRRRESNSLLHLSLAHILPCWWTKRQ